VGVLSNLVGARTLSTHVIKNLLKNVKNTEKNLITQLKYFQKLFKGKRVSHSQIG
jgi:hypothetical protein